MNLLSLDLELNQPSAKIIQLGWAIGEVETGNIIAQDSDYIAIDEPLDTRIIQLTGITDDKLTRDGKSLIGALVNLVGNYIHYNCFPNVLTWGNGDIPLLREQIMSKTDTQNGITWPFGRRWIDVKTVFVSWCLANGQPPSSGLAKSLRKMGKNFQGRKHTAQDDAVNTLRIYLELLSKMRKINND